MALVSGANRVDIARLAAVVGLSSLRRATAQEATEATGFTIGGIPPFAHKRPLRVVMDPDLGRYPDRVGGGRHPQRGVRGATRPRCACLANAIVAPSRRPPDASPSARSAPRAGGASTGA